ncbi:Glutamate-gated kainate-type ion channel receptor subunit GluR5 [Handroanthus impetiginosus]|uniref:Glutamate receptor n=1 Tax=Handroanthus impetiginosus TaxID=429701 RepID=A0A2G9I0X4_9LAMI|nr:Glutamate-gated kainate-type ion channel receptor subunit GluR5 [Handroanthus impetiginosus]
MKVCWVFFLFAFLNDYRSCGVYASPSTRPDVVRIGSIFTFDSVIGKAAKVAIEAAVEDVNSSPDVLKGTKLNITMLDSHFSGFLGIIEAIHFMATENVAIIGPQSPVTARALSYLAKELHVPLLSFSATDPTMSSLQFPYFVSTSVNDVFQMAAIADIVKYYGWRDVIAVYVDDDYGRNGISVLSDQLAARSCQISYKAPLMSEANVDDIRHVLVQVALEGSRIIVVHAYPERGIDIMAAAQYLGMMEEGYVWIATDWLSTLLDTDAPISSDAKKKIQGVLSLRIHTPESEAKKKFVSRWRNLANTEGAPHRNIGLSTYALYAYDTVWMLARAIDAFLEGNGSISFTADPKMNETHEDLHLDNINIFNEGNLLLNSILNVNMTGVTGHFKFTSDRNLIDPVFEIINIIGTGLRRIGYWSNYSGLSISPPETLHFRPTDNSNSKQQLNPVIWPGETSEKPRGWVFPQNGRQLQIGVPNHLSFQDFVARIPGTDMFMGYCIDVFLAAVNLLPYAVPYKLIPFGDGHNNPSSTELVHLIYSGVYDAAIGDIAITKNRTRMADFTQPYIKSGLVIVAPIRKSSSSAWAFLRPFTTEMWCVTGIFFLLGGAVIWFLEHRINNDFRGPPRKQVVTILWFSFSTLFSSHRENTVGTLGRFMLLLWLFVVLIIKSSYTASLTSILTMQQLSSPIEGIESLVKSNDAIGYQQGSFARDYLVEQLGIHESKLVPLKSPEDYAKALNDGPRHGGVAAIVDERAYAEVFLSTRCEFSIIGREFTKNGWGFAFPKESQLAIDMSTAIIKLSENGELQRIHDKWLLSSACSSEGAKLHADRLLLESFQGMFFACGLACIAAFLIHFVRMMLQYHRRCSELESSSQSHTSSSRSSRLHTFLSFADEKEDSVKARSVRRKTQCDSSMNIEQNASISGS